MNKQHVPLYLSLAIVIVLGGYLIYDLRKFIPEVLPSLVKSSGVAVAPDTVSNISIHRQGKYTRTDVDYPHFSGELAVLNAPIEKVINEGIAAHDKNSAENWKARVDTAEPKGSVSSTPGEQERFPFHASWSLTQFDSERVSVFLEYDEFSGGAHGSENNVTFNYDMKMHKVSTLADLFPGDVEYLNKVSKAAIGALVEDRKKATGESLISDDELKWISEGAAPKIENFQIFSTQGNRLTLYFGQYQVGPYAIGMPKVELWLPLQ